MTTADAKKVIEWRQAGKSCRECAEILSVPEWQIWRLMRDTGHAGKYRAKTYRYGFRGDSTAIGRAVKSWGEVLIEEGLNGGYIATLGDLHTGAECETVAAAIRDAEGR